MSSPIDAEGAVRPVSQSNEDLERHILDSMEAMSRLRDEVSRLKEENKKYCENFDQLSTAYVRVQEEVGRAQDETQRVSKAKAVQEKEMEEKMQLWKKELSERTKDFEKSALRPPWELDVIRIQAIEELERAYQSKFEGMEDEIEAAQALRHEYELLKTNVEMENTEHERALENAKLQYRAELAQLKEKLVSFESALDSSETDKTIEELEREVSVLKGQKNVLETDRGDAQITIDSLQRAKEQMTREFRRNTIEYESRLKLLDGEKETLELRLKRAEIQVEQYRSTNETMLRRCTNLDAELARLKAEATEYRMTTEETTKQASAVSAARLKQADSDAAHARQDSEAYRRLAIERETELEAVKKSSSVSIAEMREKMEKMEEEGRKNVDELRGEIRQLESKHASEKHEYERVIIQLRDQLEAKGKELTDAYQVVRQKPEKEDDFDVEMDVGESAAPPGDSTQRMDVIKRKLKDTVATAKRNREHYRRKLADTQARFDAISNQVALSSLEQDVARSDVELTKQRLEARLADERRRREEAELLLRVSMQGEGEKPEVQMPARVVAAEAKLKQAEAAQAQELSEISEKVEAVASSQQQGVEMAVGRAKRRKKKSGK